MASKMSGERPSKRAKLLDDSDSENSSNDGEGGVSLGSHEPELKVNEEYARRFEHNQKRAELHQC
jgi:protein KRI1